MRDQVSVAVQVTINQTERLTVVRVIVEPPPVERLLDSQRAIAIARGDAGHLDGLVAPGDGQFRIERRAIASGCGFGGDLDAAVAQLKRYGAFAIELVTSAGLIMRVAVGLVLNFAGALVLDLKVAIAIGSD